MIEDGQPDAARMELQKQVDQPQPIGQPIEAVNRQRYLGDAYTKLGMRESAAEHFTQAMQAALRLDPTWRRLSAVISVLELQAESEDEQLTRALLQQSLDAKLLLAMSRDHYASEIGRYVKRFGERASRPQLYKLLDQLRQVDKPAIRKKALYAMMELQWRPYAAHETAKAIAPSMPLRMDATERFFWFTALSHYYAGSGEEYLLKEQQHHAQMAYQQLPSAKQQKYRKFWRGVTKLTPLASQWDSATTAPALQH